MQHEWIAQQLTELPSTGLHWWLAFSHI